MPLSTKAQPTERQFKCAVATLVLVAVGETVILLHPPLILAGVSIGMEMGCQQNDSLADG